MANKISVIGLGYVGLPVLTSIMGEVELIGFDINELRVKELSAGYDRTGEVSQEGLSICKAKYTSSPEVCKASDVFIVTVPTPVTSENEPDCSYLISACEMVGKQIKNGSLVLFESTVYPGLTRNICIPALERASSLKCCHDFHVGYSPERIIPGDNSRSLKDIIKVTSGCCDKSRKKVDLFYSEFLELETYSAPTLEVAEAAKVIENTQRDVNIALMNELSEILQKAKIDTHEVIKAASTKWNFHPYTPGLVGGHCIGVDPYYLAFKAEELHVEPKLILAGRQVNNKVSSRIIKEVITHQKNVEIKSEFNVLILGATFKENCPDIRNSKSLELYSSIKNSKIDVSICDPVADFKHTREEIDPVEIEALSRYDFIILSVNHSIFYNLGIDNLRKHLKHNGKIYDVKSMFDKNYSDYRL